jgi:hypothetical protein
MTVRALLARDPSLRLPANIEGRAALRRARLRGCSEVASLVTGATNEDGLRSAAATAIVIEAIITNAAAAAVLRAERNILASFRAL